MSPKIPRWLIQGFADEGWILPDGRFVACFRADEGLPHPDVAKIILGEDGEALADRLGWLRISDYGDRCTKRLTQAQTTTLFDYCQHVGADFNEVRNGIKFLEEAVA
jgi:hypothetical protein